MGCKYEKALYSTVAKTSFVAKEKKVFLNFFNEPKIMSLFSHMGLYFLQVKVNFRNMLILIVTEIFWASLNHEVVFGVTAIMFVRNYAHGFHKRRKDL